MPEISVIVPVYNTEQYLHRCVDSILAQTFTDFELILVNDGSPDNCGVICDEYAIKDKRVHVIHRENGGLSAARNSGIDWVYANSDSQFLSFIDSDDWVHERYLELLYTASESFHVKISQCCHLMTSGDEETILIADKMLCVSPEEQFINWYSAFAWGKLYRKECFNSIRYPEGILYEDVSIWYKLLFSVDSIAIVNEALYYYYQRRDSIMNSNWTPAHFARIKAWDATVSFLADYGKQAVLTNAVYRYCHIARKQYDEIKRSKAVSLPVKCCYQVRIKLRLFRMLLNYRKEMLNNGSYLYFFEWVFPVLGTAYWTGKGIVGKFKRDARKNEGKKS